MSYQYLLICILIMAVVTYLPRVLPFVLFHKRIQSQFIQSFLSYMPYGILAAMIFPDVFTSTASVYSAIGGVLAACLLSYKKLGLLPVALGSVLTVFLLELFL